MIRSTRRSVVGKRPEADEEGTNAQQLAAGGGRSSRNAREASASRTRLEKPTEKHKAKNTTQMRTGIPTAGGRTLPTLEGGGTSGNGGNEREEWKAPRPAKEGEEERSEGEGALRGDSERSERNTEEAVGPTAQRQ